MSQITIKIIYDNRKENQAMQEGWGFSCLIDLGHRKILFDTGANKNVFFSNLQKLGIQSEGITDLFLPKGFPSYELPLHIQTAIVNEFMEIDSQVYSFVLKGGFRLYEQALALRTSKGLVVITGCAHPGITNLLETVKKRLEAPLYLVVGGFHLFRKSRRFIDKIVDAFKTLKVEKAAPCHCSGDPAIAQFQKVYQEHFCNIGTGTILTLDQ